MEGSHIAFLCQFGHYFKYLLWSDLVLEVMKFDLRIMGLWVSFETCIAHRADSYISTQEAGI